MNNFDRPRGISIDDRFTESVENIAAPGVTGDVLYTSEYTSWTALSDLKQLKFYVRSYGSINYVDFDLAKLQNLTVKKSIPLKNFSHIAANGTQAFEWLFCVEPAFFVAFFVTIQAAFR